MRQTWKVDGSETYHVAMPVEGLYASQQLFVVAEGDEDLGVVSNGLLQDGERALADLVLLKGTELCFVKLRFGNVHVLTSKRQ